MILPPYVYTEPAALAVAVMTEAKVTEVRAAELASAACALGEDFNIDPSWLCAVAIGETPTLNPYVKDGVCQVVGDASGSIWGSVTAAASLYSKIVSKHGRKDAHLYYGCGVNRCGGKWTRQAKYKIHVWKRLRKRIIENESRQS